MQGITRIGVVRSKFKEPADPHEMRNHESTIYIDQNYEDGLYKIEENEYLQIVFHFHLSEEYSLQCTTYSGSFKGVFASRSPRRPSAIGVTTVKLLEKDGRKLRVKGLDAVDGTPVLDIKPYSVFLDEKEQKNVKRGHVQKHPRIEIRRNLRAGDEEALLLRVGELHGHYCPGLALGVRAATYAMKELGVVSEGMEDILAIVETNNCFADGIQYITGCTFGNNALIYRDYGKTAFTLTKRDGKGIRVAVTSTDENENSEYTALFEKVVKERGGTDKQKARFRKLSTDEAFSLLKKNVHELFAVERVTVDLPKYAPIYESLTCEYCGEKVMALRIVEKKRKMLCIPCAGEEYFQLDGTGLQKIL